MSIVVMSREMGTLGKEVARQFARRKNYTVLHHEMVRSQADRRGRDEESEVYRFLEGSEAELDFWRNNRANDGFLTPAEMLEIACEGEVLFRGWGATRLLKGIPGVLTVRVCAPMEFRVAIMRERLGVDERTARREIDRSDAAHGRTILRFWESDWRDPLNYDLVLNTAHMTPDTCAEVLIDAVSNPAFEETTEMRRALADMMLEHRIRGTLLADAGLGPRGQHVDVAVTDGEVRLYGVVRDHDSQRRAESAARRCAPDGALRNEIAVATGFVE